MSDLPDWDHQEPDWRERLLEKVKVKQETSVTVTKGRRKANVQVFFDTPFMTMLKQAAEQRGISVGPYVRRAIAKQIAKDLGVEWCDLLVHTAAPIPYGSTPFGAKSQWGVERSHDDGEGFGDWTN